MPQTPKPLTYPACLPHAQNVLGSQQPLLDIPPGTWGPSSSVPSSWYKLAPHWFLWTTSSMRYSLNGKFCLRQLCCIAGWMVGVFSNLGIEVQVYSEWIYLTHASPLCASFYILKIPLPARSTKTVRQMSDCSHFGRISLPTSDPRRFTRTVLLFRLIRLVVHLFIVGIRQIWNLQLSSASGQLVSMKTSLSRGIDVVISKSKNITANMRDVIGRYGLFFWRFINLFDLIGPRDLCHSLESLPLEIQAIVLLWHWFQF